jgi:FdhD protein
MSAEASVAGALIAGGRSTRMGEDKAFLDWNGRPLFAHQLSKLFAVFPDQTLLLSANPAQDFPDFIENVRLIPDAESGQGPIAALRHCLENCNAERLLVLAVDLPGMTGDYLESLLQLTKESGRGIVPKLDDRWEPLAAVFPRSILPLIRDSIEAGDRSLQKLCDRAEAENLINALPVEESQRPLFANVNTREDYETIQQGQFDKPTLLTRFRKGSGFAETHDRLAAEEPLEIRIEGQSIAVVMRTPGHDDELAAGFLFTESAISGPEDLFEIAQCPDVEPEAAGNVLDVRLAPNHQADLKSLTRHVFTSSSCGICGKATIDSVFQNFPPLKSDLRISPQTLLALPNRLRAAQETFDKTGGLHASALFDAEGNLKLLREDVGRHNALDKVIGRSVLDGRVPLGDRILLVSGRISFELIQKALAAGIPLIAGISAPSSLAVEFAEKSGQTLVGFLRETGFNVYAGAERVIGG